MRRRGRRRRMAFRARRWRGTGAAGAPDLDAGRFSRAGAARTGPTALRPSAASIDMARRCPKARPARRAGKTAPAPDAAALLRALGECAVAALPVSPQSARLHLEGRRLIAAPLDAPELDGLRVVSPGLALLRAETARVEPEHALAMALLPGMARREAALTEKKPSPSSPAKPCPARVRRAGRWSRTRACPSAGASRPGAC